MKRLFQNIPNWFQKRPAWFLPTPLGRWTSFYLKLLFSGVSFEKDQAAVFDQLPPGAVVVYVNKHKSHLERMFFYACHSEKGIPCPEIGIGYGSFFFQPFKRVADAWRWVLTCFKQTPKAVDPFDDPAFRKELDNGRTAFFSLVNSGKLRNPESARRDPLAFFIKMQETTDRPIYFIPFLFFYGNHSIAGGGSPISRPAGVDPKPGILHRLFFLLVAPEKVFVELSDPVDLQRCMPGRNRLPGADIEWSALHLRRQLMDQITRHRQSMTGPILKPIEEIRQQVLSTDRLRSFMHRYAKRRKITLFQIQQEAVKYVDEIAARPSPLAIQMGAVAVRWILDYLFEGISVNKDGLKRMKQASRTGPVVIMPCHKSNFDSMVVSHILNGNGMPHPHVFAGKNLAFFPMGPIFRKFGAFFVRRSFKGAVFYSKVFSEYIYMLLDQGFNVEVFIEGTRSRNGKLLLPKLGMLSIILNAVKHGAMDDLHFVPVFIGYDRVPELKSYIHELDGGQKEPESFSNMIKVRKLFRKRFGRVYLKFCDPISLKEMTGRYGTSVGTLSPKMLNRLCRDLGGRVMSDLDGNAMVTPQALASSAILNCSGKVISRRQIGRMFDTYLNYLVRKRADVARILLTDPDQALDSVIHYYIKVKYIRPVKRNGSGPETDPRYKVIPTKRADMEYYKNNCIAFFVSASFTAMSMLSHDAFLFTPPDLYTKYQFLRDLFSSEFNQNPDEPPDAQIRRVVNEFESAAILTAHPTLPETFTLTSKGYRDIKRFAAFLIPFLESYRIVLEDLKDVDNKGFKKSERLKSSRALGHRMFKRGEIRRNEAISTANFENALEIYKRKGLTRPGVGEKTGDYREKLDRFLNLLS